MVGRPKGSFIPAWEKITKVRTTILIDQDDYDFMKKKGLKATNLLRKKIKDLKINPDGLDLESANKKLTELNERILAAARSVLSDKQFNLLLRKI